MREERFEELLGSVLEERVGVAPRGGLEGRVLARVATAGRGSRQVLLWGVGGVVVVLVLAVAAGHGRGTTKVGEGRGAPTAEVADGLAEKVPLPRGDAIGIGVRGETASWHAVHKRGRRRVRKEKSRMVAEETVGRIRVAELRIAPLDVAPLAVE